MTTLDESFYCSDRALQGEEPLPGTAPVVTTWFLLEYSGRWEPEAFKDSALADPIKTHLSSLLDSIPRSRIQMIRQQSRPTSEGVALYIVLSREVHPVLYAFQLASVEDLLTLDIAAVLAEDPAYAEFVQREPLFLVCTHGRRDKCCSRYGLPVFDMMVQSVGERVWQSSHLAGHRFAANVVCFPHGIYYGRVRPEHVHTIVKDYRENQLYPALYRGRSCYTEPVQAAEYFLRSSTGITDLNAFRLLEVECLTESVCEVRFYREAENLTHFLQLGEEELPIYTSCGDIAPSRVKHYRLMRHDVIGPPA